VTFNWLLITLRPWKHVSVPFDLTAELNACFSLKCSCVLHVRLIGLKDTNIFSIFRSVYCDYNNPCTPTSTHSLYKTNNNPYTFIAGTWGRVYVCVDDLRFYINCAFLGAFAKLRKATISFIMFVRPSVRPSVCVPVRSYGTTRLPLDGLSWKLMFEYFFRKCVEKIQVSLKSDKNNGYLALRLLYIYDILLKCFRQICRQNQDTRLIFNNFFPKIVACLISCGKQW